MSVDVTDRGFTFPSHGKSEGFLNWPGRGPSVTLVQGPEATCWRDAPTSKPDSAFNRASLFTPFCSVEDFHPGR